MDENLKINILAKKLVQFGAIAAQSAAIFVQDNFEPDGGDAALLRYFV